jgi:hypothetical protein
MKKITKIGAKSFARVLGFLYGLLGLVGGVVVFLISLFSLITGHTSGIVVGIIFLILIPIAYGLMGFVLGYLTALLYNYVAKKTGGIEFEVE